MSIKKIFVFILLFNSIKIVFSQNIILNGSFEDNIATHQPCGNWNAMSEQEYDSIINYSTSIYFNNQTNLVQGIDLFDSICGSDLDAVTTPQHENWYITINSWNYGDSIVGKEAITFMLHSMLKNTNTYNLSFYSYSLSYPSFSNLLKIGASNNPKMIGQQLFEVIPDTSYWQEFSFQFTPDNDYQYISVWVEDNGYGHGLTGIDNFILTSLTNTEEKLSNGINIYPNPSFGKIYFELEQNSEYNIYDLQGRTVLNGKVTKGNNEICITNLESGIYIVDVGGFKKKIIKQ